jgi:hypothetical protein
VDCDATLLLPLLQCTLGIWFLKNRRVPINGLLKIVAAMILTYIFWFKVGSHWHSRTCELHLYFILGVPCVRVYVTIRAWVCVCARVSGVVSCPYFSQVHFWALPKTGDRADAFVPVEFTKPYEKTLLNNPDYDVRRTPRACASASGRGVAHIHAGYRVSRAAQRAARLVLDVPVPHGQLRDVPRELEDHAAAPLGLALQPVGRQRPRSRVLVWRVQVGCHRCGRVPL